MKLLDGDRHVLLVGQLGHGLADVTVAANNLRHREAYLEHVAAVQRSALSDRSDRLGGGLRDAQSFDELVQEEGNAILQLVYGRPWSQSRHNLCPDAREEFYAVGADELTEHRAQPAHA